MQFDELIKILEEFIMANFKEIRERNNQAAGVAKKCAKSNSKVINVNVNVSETLGESAEIIANKKRWNDILFQAKNNKDPITGVAIVHVHVDMMFRDKEIQTNLRYGTKAFNKAVDGIFDDFDWFSFDPPVLSAHIEKGLFCVVDGLHRIEAAKRKGDEYIPCKILLETAEMIDTDERQRYEAQIFKNQDKNKRKLQLDHRLGAFRVLGEEGMPVYDKMRQKFGFDYSGTSGQSKAGDIGSLKQILDIAKSQNGEAALDWCFVVLVEAGYDRETNGYSVAIIRCVYDMWKLYANERTKVSNFISKLFRAYPPLQIIHFAKSKYPCLDYRTAASKWLEDECVKALGVQQIRSVNEIGTKLIEMTTKETA
jgi:hypothetical protein